MFVDLNNYYAELFSNFWFEKYYITVWCLTPFNIVIIFTIIAKNNYNRLFFTQQKLYRWYKLGFLLDFFLSVLSFIFDATNSFFSFLWFVFTNVSWVLLAVHRLFGFPFLFYCVLYKYILPLMISDVNELYL